MGLVALAQILFVMINFLQGDDTNMVQREGRGNKLKVKQQNVKEKKKNSMNGMKTKIKKDRA